MPPPSLTILRSYAQKAPESLPASILFTHSDNNITIFDAYPKSIFHFLILPRVVKPLTVSNLSSLRTLLQCEKNQAKAVLDKLKDDAAIVQCMIEEEMAKRYGFKWGVSMGFHPVPSMEHLHLHVMSNDLCSPSLKNKKHYNSFHPKLGFFLHLEDVLEWFTAEPHFYDTMAELSPRQYEHLLKEDLTCWQCSRGMKNIPALKAHLQEEWDALAEKEKAKIKRANQQKDKKRKHSDVEPNIAAGSDGEAPSHKRQETEHESSVKSAI